MVIHTGKFGMGVLASIALMGGSLMASSPALAQTAPDVLSSLTAAQRTQATQVARQTEQINTTTGYVHVSPTILAHHGLDSAQMQIAYVENTIKTYDMQHDLTATTPSALPSTISPMTYPANTAIWDTYGLGRTRPRGLAVIASFSWAANPFRTGRAQLTHPAPQNTHTRESAGRCVTRGVASRNQGGRSQAAQLRAPR